MNGQKANAFFFLVDKENFLYNDWKKTPET
jgi:hypothetical protein